MFILGYGRGYGGYGGYGGRRYGGNNPISKLILWLSEFCILSIILQDTDGEMVMVDMVDMDIEATIGRKKCILFRVK